MEEMCVHMGVKLVEVAHVPKAALVDWFLHGPPSIASCSPWHCSKGAMLNVFMFRSAPNCEDVRWSNQRCLMNKLIFNLHPLLPFFQRIQGQNSNKVDSLTRVLIKHFMKHLVKATSRNEGKKKKHRLLYNCFYTQGGCNLSTWGFRSREKNLECKVNCLGNVEHLISSDKEGTMYLQEYLRR